jgi:hypothetical protein
MFLRFPCCPSQAHERFLKTARIALFYSVLVVAFALRLLPYGRSVTSRSIGNALADDALQSKFGASRVIYSKPHAIGMPEIELRQIAVEMLSLQLIDALHAAFEDRVAAFDRVGVDRLGVQPIELVNPELMPDIFFLAVVYGLVARVVLADRGTPCFLICH